jgi:hypothetical protein
MMKPLRATNITLALLLLLTSGLGCRKDVRPPSPLPADQFAATFNKAFAGAKAEAKDLAAQIVTAVQAQDYPKAFAQLQSLTSAPGLTKGQQSVLARALLTVNDLLAAAQSQGDQKAAQTIQTYQRNR